MNRGKSNLDRGFTLTELAIVLGIIGLILGAIWTAASKVYFNQRINKGMTEMLAITSSIRAVYGSKPYFPSAGQTDVTCAMVNLGVFPSDMLPSAACVASNTATYPQNPWGGQVVVYSSTSGPDASATQFEVQYIPVPTSAIAALVFAVDQQGMNNGLTYIYYNAAWHGAAGVTVSGIGTITDTNFSSDWKLSGN